MKKTIIYITFCFITILSLGFFISKTAPSYDRIRTKIFGQYTIWLGTNAFASGGCTNQYEEIQDKIKYINLCSGLENIIFKNQVLKIEKGECYCYKTEYK